MKYLRMDLDISADLRVVSLSKMAEIPIEEAIGIAILIWVGAAKNERVVITRGVPESILMECGLIDENGLLPHKNRSSYKRDWARQKRVSRQLLSTERDSNCPQKTGDKHKEINGKEKNVDSRCPQMWTVGVHTESGGNDAKEVKPPKNKDNDEKQKKLVTGEPNYYNSRITNLEHYKTSSLNKVIRITNNSKKEKRNKKEKKGTWNPELFDVSFQDVLDGKLDAVAKKDLPLSVIRKVSSEAYKHVFDFSISPNSVEIKKAIKTLIIEEGRKPSEIIKAIFGIERDTWKDRKKYRSFRYIHKNFDAWVELFEKAPDSAEAGTYGPWRDEGYATREAWMADKNEITIDGDGAWEN